MKAFTFYRGILILTLIASIVFIHCSTMDKHTSPPTFQIEPGFSLKLVAKEPLITDPVDIEFDEYGDAYVMEMPGYPLEDAQSKIILLKDTNADGEYDKRTVYAANLRMANSMMAYRKGFLVAAPPYLLFLKDTDGDYMADKTDTIMGGFSTGNLQHNYNGLIYGLDGWVYAANGGNSGSPYWWPDSTHSIPLRGNDIRFDIETKRLERLGRSSGGFGITMDDFGRLFGTHNLHHISQLVFPDRYVAASVLSIPNTLKNISDHEENGLARIYPIGEQESRVNHPEQSGYFSGSCGITYYGGGVMGEEYNQTVWVADVVLNLLHVDKIKLKGSELTASRVLEKRDFLASTDRAHRPVNMNIGPDGSMYLVDMYRNVIEHPEWIPDDMEATLDLHAGKDKGRIYKIVKDDLPINKYTPPGNVEELIAALSSDNQWQRKTAHRLLNEAELNQHQLGELKKNLTSTNNLSRLHASWILNKKNALQTEELLVLLADKDPGIRENALQLAETHLSVLPLLESTINATIDDNQRVRMQAALSLSTITKSSFDANKEKIISALTKACSLPMDTWNIAAITLADKYDPSTLFNSVASGSGNNKDLLVSLANQSTADKSQLVIVFSLIEKIIKEDTLQDQILNAIIPKINDIGLAGTLSPLISSLENKNNASIISTLSALRKNLKLPVPPAYIKLSKSALQELEANNLTDDEVVDRLKFIPSFSFKESSKILFKYLDNTKSIAIQEAVLKQLNDIKEKEVGQELVNHWSSLGPLARTQAGNILLYRYMHHDALLTALETKKINIGEMNFDLERMRTLLLWSNSDEVKKRAAALFKDSGVVSRKDALEKMKPALALKGDVEKGATVFTRICTQCHKFGDLGNEVGPILTEISRKSKESILQDIVDPNAAVNTNFINHKLETKSGDIHIGIIDKETDQEISLKKMGGSMVTIPKKDIKELRSLGTSLMMEGLEGNMTLQEMADLLAYLQHGVK
ncbi:MAG: PVC-type heme-binding CxxCH protein [Saprospiraceae bacterium]